MNHTPTPWVAEGNRILSGGFQVAETGGDWYDNGRKDKRGFSANLPTKANAVFIAHACNEYHVLVWALGQLQAVVDPTNAVWLKVLPVLKRNLNR